MWKPSSFDDFDKVDGDSGYVQILPVILFTCSVISNRSFNILQMNCPADRARRGGGQRMLRKSIHERGWLCSAFKLTFEHAVQETLWCLFCRCAFDGVVRCDFGSIVRFRTQQRICWTVLFLLPSLSMDRPVSQICVLLTVKRFSAFFLISDVSDGLKMDVSTTSAGSRLKVCLKEGYSVSVSRMGFKLSFNSYTASLQSFPWRKVAKNDRLARFHTMHSG